MKAKVNKEKEINHIEVTDLLDEFEAEEEVKEIEKEIADIDRKLEKIKKES